MNSFKKVLLTLLLFMFIGFGMICFSASLPAGIGMIVLASAGFVMAPFIAEFMDMK